MWTFPDQKLFDLTLECRGATVAGVSVAAGFEESDHGRTQMSDLAQAGHAD